MSLQNDTIVDFSAFETLFKNKWEDKKNPRHYLSQYHSMRRKECEFVQEFSDRFMKVYNAIPAQFKPPTGSAQLQYVESFDNEFTLLLCQRKPTSLADMMNEAVEVEVNLTAARRKKRDEGEW